MKLEYLGWNSFFAEHFDEYKSDGYAAARVSLEHKNLYTVLTECGEMPAILTGKFYYEADERQDLPVVGDWVVVRIYDEQPPKATVHGILPRKSKFSRKEAGAKISEQLVAANIDTVFIVVGLDHNYSTRRIERYLTMAWESGANPIVVLSKADVCDDLDNRIMEAESVAMGAPVHAVSVIEDSGLEVLSDYLAAGQTVALLGSSGVGKSTIINYLLGKDVQKVQEVRSIDGRGRHTTTHRELFTLASGALVIDTPGMRELQLWNADDGLTETFKDIEDLAGLCRFGDCKHEDEPGCAVLEAVDNGALNRSRFENYRKMQKELDYLVRKQDLGAELAEKRKWKNIHKQIRRFKK